MKTLKLAFIGFLAICSTEIHAQGLWVDVYAGAMNYQGDLQDKRYTFNQAHLGGGAGLTYDISEHFSARLRFTYGKVSADDAYGKNRTRNLNFSSNLFEGQLALQYYLWPLNSRSMTPYAFAGLGVFHFNPYTHDTTGVKYFLKPLSTEGQGFVEGRDPYSLTQISIPFGGGVKLSLTDDINVGLELGLRKTFTDHLDDVSNSYTDPAILLAERGPKSVELSYRGGELKGGRTAYPYPPGPIIRGNPKSLDWYYFTALTVSFRIGGSNGMGGDARWKRQYECPRF